MVVTPRVRVAFGAAAVLCVLGVAALGSGAAAAGDVQGELRIDSVRAAGGPVVLDGFAPGLTAGPVTVASGDRELAAGTVGADRIPLEVAFVVDDAAGQPNGTVQLAADALEQLLPGSGGPVRATVLTTSGGPDVLVPLSEDPEAVRAALDQVVVSDSRGSDLLGTITSAADLLGRGDPTARRAVVVLAATPERGPATIGAAERALVGAGASVEALVVGRSAPVGQLARLVDASGGEVLPLGSDEQYEEGVGRIGALLASRFRTEVDPGSGPVERTLTVGLDGASTAVTLAPGFDRRGPAALAPPVVDSPSVVGRVLDNPVVVALVALTGAAALVLAAWMLVSMLLGRRQLAERLEAYDESAVVAPDGPPVAEVATVPILQRAVAITGSIADRQGLLERLEHELERANLPLRAAEALFFGLAAAVLGSALVFLLSGSLLVAVAALLIGVMLPRVVINIRIRRRVATFESQLPDMLDLLAGTLRAGYSISQGIDAVSKEIPDPMGRELQRVVNEHRLGRSLEESLEGVADRMGSEDFAWAVMAIRIQREVGGNLAELLLTVSKTMTQRDRLRRDVASLTAEGRMSAMVLGLMPFILGAVMYVVNPEYVTALLTPGLGYLMLGGSLVSMLVGFIWMKKLITVEI